jgi:hypothetical protein
MSEIQNQINDRLAKACAQMCVEFGEIRHKMSKAAVDAHSKQVQQAKADIAADEHGLAEDDETPADIALRQAKERKQREKIQIASQRVSKLSSELAKSRQSKP